MSWYFQAFVIWRLSLAVCCAFSERQSSSGRISASVSEQRDHGPFPTDVLATLTLFLLVLLNPAASWDVCLTPGIPALTSRAGASLSFVFLTPPAASCPHALPELPVSVWIQLAHRSSVSVWFACAPVFRLVACVPRLMVSVCCLVDASPRVRPLPRAGGYRFPAPECSGSLPLPFIF